MPLEVDYFSKLLKVTAPDVTITGQVLHNFVEDEMASPIGMISDGDNASFKGDILKPEGKIEDPTNPGVFSIIILLLNPEWQIQFWAGSGYTKLTGAKIVGGVGDEPMKATGTAGDITVLESPVDGTLVESSTSGLTASESAQLGNIDTATAYHTKIINNEKELHKIGVSWYLIIYDDGQSFGGTEILRKKQTDIDGNDITDLVAGLLSAELETSV